MGRLRLRRTALAAAAALALLAPGAARADSVSLDLFTTGPQAGGADSKDSYNGSTTSDGSRYFFQTPEPLVPADTDVYDDVYMRTGGVTTLLSTPVAGNNSAGAANVFGVSPDGQKVLLWAEEHLTAADTDPPDSGIGRFDLYLWNNGTLTLITDTPGGGDGAFDAGLNEDHSADFSIVYFATKEKMLSTDSDASNDVFKSVNGTVTEHVSDRVANPAGDLEKNALSIVAATDGSRDVFSTNEALTADDNDTDSFDFYGRIGGVTSLLTDRIDNPTFDSSVFGATFAAASSDATHFFFTTKESLVAADTDSNHTDLYERFGSTTTLVSDRIKDSSDAPVDLTSGFGNTFASSDGSRIFFTTVEQLVADDVDNSVDVYERSGGVTRLVSDSPADQAKDATTAGITPDGLHVYVATTEPLVAADGDSAQDIYDFSGGTFTLLSDRTQAGADAELPASLGSRLADGSKVMIGTAEPLTCLDGDSSRDVYIRAGGTTTLLTDRQQAGADEAIDAAASFSQGGRPLVTSAEQLTAADTDASGDVYAATVTAGADPCPRPTDSSPPPDGNPPPDSNPPPPDSPPPPPDSPPPGPTVTGPAGNPLGLPRRRRCVDTRKFSFKLHHPPGATIVKVEVFINGKRTMVKRGTNITRLTLKRLPKRKFVVKIVATQSSGSKLISKRTYKGCKKSKARTRARHHR